MDAGRMRLRGEADHCQRQRHDRQPRLRRLPRGREDPAPVGGVRVVRPQIRVAAAEELVTISGMPPKGIRLCRGPAPRHALSPAWEVPSVFYPLPKGGGGGGGGGDGNAVRWPVVPGASNPLTLPSPPLALGGAKPCCSWSARERA